MSAKRFEVEARFRWAGDGEGEEERLARLLDQLTRLAALEEPQLDLELAVFSAPTGPAGEG